MAYLLPSAESLHDRTEILCETRLFRLEVGLGYGNNLENQTSTWEILQPNSEKNSSAIERVRVAAPVTVVTNTLQVLGIAGPAWMSLGGVLRRVSVTATATEMSKAWDSV